MDARACNLRMKEPQQRIAEMHECINATRCRSFKSGVRVLGNNA
jgi:hypothetical protein